MCKCDVCGKELTEDELFYFYTLKEITKPISLTVGEVCEMTSEYNYYLFIQLCGDCLNELREHLTSRAKEITGKDLDDNLKDNISMFLTKNGMDIFIPLINSVRGRKNDTRRR